MQLNYYSSLTVSSTFLSFAPILESAFCKVTQFQYFAQTSVWQKLNGPSSKINVGCANYLESLGTTTESKADVLICHTPLSFLCILSVVPCESPKYDSIGKRKSTQTGELQCAAQPFSAAKSPRREYGDV